MLADSESLVIESAPVPTDVPLRCRCGSVCGVAANVGPVTGTRLVCYCIDCQVFARFLKRDDILDAAGGTGIYHMRSSDLRITEGKDQLRCVRLSDKGLYRWYTDCCRTPIGNMVGARLPFIGVTQPFMEHENDGHSREAVLGRSRESIFGKDAIGGLPANAREKASAAILLRTGRLVLKWLLTARGKPTEFFDPETRAPRSAPLVLAPEERAALATRSIEP